MAERVIPFAVRTVDENTISDLFCIAAEQAKAADKVSEAMDCDFIIPFSESILDIIFDAVGAPDDNEFREPFFELFFDWVHSETQSMQEFLKEFYLCLDDHLHMYSVREHDSATS
ncbi:hypothetical protein SAMN05660691_04118 [Rheinheimera pacifica]|uniref:Uncharacterized protein n=1 Tax=Rheinheimera pacifica TaxID=173990 RepID=A0A1H6NRU2_9GAMM|nr:hypothetical protein [Rheinheimera pacifica]SEI13687.1 hypothetical protein SAMN05660691_04118 [Rheinheimera pacifica]|tara:strand:+ start:5970 stop:6314 length:345 start_codon:yes stop_codon:yes gene_type:complete